MDNAAITALPTCRGSKMLQSEQWIILPSDCIAEVVNSGPHFLLDHLIMLHDAWMCLVLAKHPVQQWVCLLNSFILYHYSACTSRNLTYLDYRVELAKLLIGNYCSRKRPGQPLSTPSTKRITVQHYPTKTSGGRCSYSKNGRTV